MLSAGLKEACSPYLAGRLREPDVVEAGAAEVTLRHAAATLQCVVVPPPDDYVVATGETHSVQSFLDLCCGLVNLDPEEVVRIDPRYFRPTEVETLLGDPTKAREKLGWVPEIGFTDLVREMMREDLKEAERDALCRREGFKTLQQHE